MVDVVSLSLGYFCESPPDVAYTSTLKAAIDALLNLGVIVVAAAGNYAVRRRFYPAAFAAAPRPAGAVPLVSVGALNPNGTRALFSDDGPWVTAWAPGAMVVSTFPTDVNGSLMPPAEGAAATPGRPGRRSTRTTSAAASPPGAAPRSPPRHWPRGCCGRCLTARKATARWRWATRLRRRRSAARCTRCTSAAGRER